MRSRTIPITKIIEKLDKISKQEKLNVDKDAFFAIAKAASGSMRDAESILDQLSSFSNKKIKFSDVTNVLGMVEEDYLFEIADKIFEKDAVGAIKLIDKLINEGKNTRQFIMGLIEHFRNLMIARVGGKSLEGLLDLPPEIKDKVLKQSQKFSIQEIVNAIETFVVTQEIARKIDSLHIPLEMAVTKLASGGSGPGEESVKPAIKQNPKNNPKKENIPVNTVEPIIKEDNPRLDKQEASGTSFQDVKNGWSDLISKISAVKMSVATFLQEGVPLRVDNDILIIGFAKESNLHRELLQRDDNRRLIETNLEQILDKKIRVKFEVTEEIQSSDSQHEPFIKSTIDTFKGRLIGKWHKKD